MTYFENTQPEFFAHWSEPELHNECARLNQVLKDLQDILQKAEYILNEGIQS